VDLNLASKYEPKIDHCTGETEKRADGVLASPKNQQLTGLGA